VENVRFSAEVLQIDKEDDGGRWLLSYTPPNDTVVLRLRISVGGRWDWHIFQAEVQTSGEKSTVLGSFDIAPVELLRTSAPSSDTVDAFPWKPVEEPDFQRIPSVYRPAFEMMVREWGNFLAVFVPAPAWLSVH
jgi:hypothetical protein